jgi:hypothetical protein
MPRGVYFGNTLSIFFMIRSAHWTAAALTLRRKLLWRPREERAASSSLLNPLTRHEFQSELEPGLPAVKFFHFILEFINVGTSAGDANHFPDVLNQLL